MLGKLLLGGAVLYGLVWWGAVDYWTSWDPATPEGQERAVLLAMAQRDPRYRQSWAAVNDRLTPAQRAYLTSLGRKLPPPGTPLAQEATRVAADVVANETMTPADKRRYARELAAIVASTPSVPKPVPAAPRYADAAPKPGVTNRVRRRKRVVDVGKAPLRGSEHFVAPKPETQIHAPPVTLSFARMDPSGYNEVNLDDDEDDDFNPNLDDVEDE